jgi:hypothetical protein
MTTKRCCTCQDEKLLDCFTKRRSTPDGRQKQCRVCAKAAKAASLEKAKAAP